MSDLHPSTANPAAPAKQVPEYKIMLPNRPPPTEKPVDEPAIACALFPMRAVAMGVERTLPIPRHMEM